MSSSLAEFEEIQRAAKERADIVAKYDLGREEGAQIDPWEDPAFEVYHVTDRYGFIHDRALPTHMDAAEEKAKQVEKERTTKWLKMLSKWDKYFPGEKLTRRVFKGIPDCVRGEVWSKLLNIPRVKAEQEGIYMRMRERARTKSTSIRQIDLDVNRTYRNHIMFRERYGVKQQALFHVLAAYSVYNTEIGYCQGMSEIAALLLMYLNEEDAFWGLSQLFVSPRHTMHGFFMHGFPKLLRFQEHYDNVLKKFVPKIRKHMEKNEMYPTLYTIKWFLQCFLDRTPFHLTLRLWDVHMLEGDQLLIAMAYCIIKMHRRRIMKMQMDDLLTFFQSNLEKDFSYDNDTVIEQLQICMEELKKARMSVPPKPKVNESPTLPFGLEIQPSVEQLIGRRSEETVDEHFRKNVTRQSGKAAYLRRKNTGGSVSGGNNLLSTPEMSRSHVDTRSLQSRMSQYSIDDKSSYYDTATNSRLSLVDYSAKTSAPSSRTSFGESSEMGSMSALGHGFTTPIDLDDVGVDVATPTTPTNPPLPPTNQYAVSNSLPPVMSQSYEQPRSSSSYDQQATLKASASLEMSPRRVVTTFDSSPGVVTSREHTVRPPHHQHRSGKSGPTSSASYDNSLKNVSSPSHHHMKSSRSYEANHTSGSNTPKHSSSYDQHINRTQDHQSLQNVLPVAMAKNEQKPSTLEDSDSAKSPAGSTTSDYDNINGMYDVEAEDVNNRYGPRGDNVTVIPISKSDGYVSSTHASEMVIVNGYDGHMMAQMKMAKTDNDIQRSHRYDHRDQRAVDYQNGYQMERQTSYQLSQATNSQTKSVYTKTIEKTAYL